MKPTELSERHVAAAVAALLVAGICVLSTGVSPGAAAAESPVAVLQIPVTATTVGGSSPGTYSARLVVTRVAAGKVTMASATGRDVCTGSSSARNATLSMNWVNPRAGTSGSSFVALCPNPTIPTFVAVPTSREVTTGAGLIFAGLSVGGITGPNAGNQVFPGVGTFFVN